MYQLSVRLLFVFRDVDVGCAFISFFCSLYFPKLFFLVCCVNASAI